MFDGQPDYRSFHHRQFAVVVRPGSAAFQLGMQPLPGTRGGSAVAGGGSDRGHRRAGPGHVPGEPELRPVPGPPARPAITAARRRGEVQHAVAADPAQQLDRQAGQQERQAGDVIPGVEDGQDGRISLPPLPRGAQPGHDI